MYIYILLSVYLFIYELIYICSINLKFPGRISFTPRGFPQQGAYNDVMLHKNLTNRDIKGFLGESGKKRWNDRWGTGVWARKTYT